MWVDYTIYSRYGLDAPGEEVASGRLGSWLQSSIKDPRQPAAPLRVFPGLDILIPAGDYYVSIQSESPASINVLAGADLQPNDLQSPWIWLTSNYPTEPFAQHSDAALGVYGSLDIGDCYTLAIALLGDPVEMVTVTDLSDMNVGDLVKIVEPKVVTASSGTFTDGSYYIEDIDRANGTKVMGGPAVNAGDWLTLVGTVGVDANGEKVILVSALTSRIAGTELAPLGMSNRSSGDELADGLLVRVWGIVTYKAPDAGYIYIDDGSGLSDGTGHTGIRIVLDGLSSPITETIQQDQHITVTGLAGLAKDPTTTVRAIRPRGDADID